MKWRQLASPAKAMPNAFPYVSLGRARVSQPGDVRVSEVRPAPAPTLRATWRRTSSGTAPTSRAEQGAGASSHGRDPVIILHTGNGRTPCQKLPSVPLIGLSSVNIGSGVHRHWILLGNAARTCDPVASGPQRGAHFTPPRARKRPLGALRCSATPDVDSMLLRMCLHVGTRCTFRFHAHAAASPWLLGRRI